MAMRTASDEQFSATGSRAGAALGSTATLFFSCGAVLLLALVLGGGKAKELPTEAIVELAALPLFILAVLEFSPVAPPREFRGALSLMCCAFALPIVQLVPLPPAVWTHLPGRATFAEAYEAAQIPLPWSPISLDPESTRQSLLVMIPAAAIFLAVVSLPLRLRAILSLVVFAFASASLCLAFMQKAGGPDSPLRFYTVTNRSVPTGFFANTNHFAALLYGMLPLIAAWTSSLIVDRRAGRAAGLLLCFVMIVCVMLGLGMTQSRSGLGLALIGACASMVLVWTSVRSPKQRKIIVVFLMAAGVVGIAVIIQFALPGLLRLQHTLKSEPRLLFFLSTARIANDFLPFGSGLGTFVRTYLMHEDPSKIWNEYVNHAHNDWLELWLEGGVAAALLLAGFCIWFARRGVQLWRAKTSSELLHTNLARAGWIVVGLFALHSIADYPLRTVANMSLFAFCAALTLPAPLTGSEDRGPILGFQRLLRAPRWLNPILGWVGNWRSALMATPRRDQRVTSNSKKQRGSSRGTRPRR